MWKSKGMNDVKVPKPRKSTAFPPYLVLLLPTVWEIVGVYFHSLAHEKLKVKPFSTSPSAIGVSPPTWTEKANTPLQPLPLKMPPTRCLLDRRWACTKNTDKEEGQRTSDLSRHFNSPSTFLTQDPSPFILSQTL